MSTYQQGDIVIIEYPYSDGTGSKVRPVVIISNDTANATDKDMLFAKITTNQRGDAFSMALNTTDTLRPLPRNSEARANKIYTLDRDLIKQHLTTMTTQSFIRFVELIKTVIE
jgi:mRNA interferase MazF